MIWNLLEQSKKERENPPEQSKKGEVKAPHVVLSFSLPFFGAELKAIKGHFPNRITGLQDTLLQHKNWSFSWTINCGRSSHKASAATSAVKGNDEKDKTRAGETEKAAIATEVATIQGQ